MYDLLEVLEKESNNIVITVNNGKEYSTLMGILEELGYSWGYRVTNPIDLPYNNKYNLIFVNNKSHTIYRYDLYPDSEGGNRRRRKRFSYTKVYNFSDFKNIKIRKKIKNLDVDTFEEEDWGYIQENMSDKNKKDIKKAIKINNRILYYIKKYDWDDEMKELVGETFIKYTYIKNKIFCKDLKINAYKIYQIIDEYHVERFIPIDCVDILDLKRIKNDELDPFDEENWGWEMKESVYTNNNFQNNKNKYTKMKHLKDFKIFEESDEEIKFKNKIFSFENKGEIRYRVYEDDVIVFMGSYVDKKFRGQGIFKNMLLELLPEFNGKDVYVPISNKKIVELFLRLGFEIIKKPIRYWGNPENTINVYKKF